MYITEAPLCVQGVFVGGRNVVCACVYFCAGMCAGACARMHKYSQTHTDTSISLFVSLIEPEGHRFSEVDRSTTTGILLPLHL